MKKIVIYVLAALAVIFIVIQFVPVEARTNPPVESDIGAPAEIDSILRRSCYDCHSHETNWPWYNRVAPASWLVAKDVREARKHLNFSTWGRYNAERRARLLEEIWEEVEEGEMPLWFYVPLHPEAKLSDDDMQQLEAWTKRSSSLFQTKADVEEAVGDFLKEGEKALENASGELKKAGEKALEAAQDAIEKARKEAEKETERSDNSGPGSANSGRGNSN